MPTARRIGLFLGRGQRIAGNLTARAGVDLRDIRVPVSPLSRIPLLQPRPAMLAFQVAFEHPCDRLVALDFRPGEELFVRDARVLETEVEL